jgi:hypothetical protein
MHIGLLGEKPEDAERTGGNRRSYWCSTNRGWVPRAATGKARAKAERNKQRRGRTPKSKGNPSNQNDSLPNFTQGITSGLVSMLQEIIANFYSSNGKFQIEPRT